MSGSRTPVVVIHQTAPSISSGYTASSGSSSSSYASHSSRGSSTPRSLSPSDDITLRVYGAAGHASTMRINPGVTVFNHNQAGSESGAPSPGYGGGFPRRT